MSVKAKKHLGQHFLKDENIAKKIADSLSEKGYDTVLEIGPGFEPHFKFTKLNFKEYNCLEINKSDELNKETDTGFVAVCVADKATIN